MTINNIYLYIFIISITILVLFVIDFFIKRNENPIDEDAEEYYNYQPTSTFSFIPSEYKGKNLTTFNQYLTNTQKTDGYGEAINQCSKYNTRLSPTQVQDCPDSSFSFVNNIADFVPNENNNYSGCIQLKYDGNACYNKMNSGEYVPNMEILKIRSS
jgi:hypothetical protein